MPGTLSQPTILKTWKVPQMLCFKDELPLDLDVLSWIARDSRNFGFKIPTDDHDRISPPALQKISCEIKFVNVSDKKVMSKMTKLFTS